MCCPFPVVSQLCQRCCGAVAPPLPPSRSPCRHVAVAPSRSRCHRALAGDRHAYTPCAVPRCLVGCRSPLASCLVGGVVRVVVAVVGGGRRAYAPCAVLVSLPGRPWLCAPLGVVVGIIVGTVVGILIAGGVTSSSLASSIINANTASSTPVRHAAFVTRGHTSALWCLPHPRAQQRPLPSCWWRRRSPRLGAAWR